MNIGKMLEVVDPYSKFDGMRGIVLNEQGKDVILEFNKKHHSQLAENEKIIRIPISKLQKVKTRRANKK